MLGHRLRRWPNLVWVFRVCWVTALKEVCEDFFIVSLYTNIHDIAAGDSTLIIGYVIAVEISSVIA